MTGAELTTGTGRGTPYFRSTSLQRHLMFQVRTLQKQVTHTIQIIMAPLDLSMSLFLRRALERTGSF